MLWILPQKSGILQTGKTSRMVSLNYISKEPASQKSAHVFQASINGPHVHDVKNPVDHGWREEDDKLLPIWVSLPLARDVLQVGVKSTRKSTYSLWKCRKSTLKCTCLCKYTMCEVADNTKNNVRSICYSLLIIQILINISLDLLPWKCTDTDATDDMIFVLNAYWYKFASSDSE